MFSKGVAKHKVIDEFITIIDNEKLLFTVLRCSDYYKATHLRFSFLTREKIAVSVESWEDGCKNIRWWRNKRGRLRFTSISVNNIGDRILLTSSSSPSTISLIGILGDRDEITRAFNESLGSEMEKENKKRERTHIKNRQMQLM